MYRLSLILILVPLAALAGRIDYVSVTRDGPRYVLEGEAFVAAQPAAVYAAITDYNSLDKLDKGIAESRLLERIDDNIALVYTRLTGCVIVFCRKVERVERVEEVSDTEVQSVVVPQEQADIAYERSSWRLSAEADGTRIKYRTEIEPDFWIPAFIGPAVLRGVLKRRVSRTLGNLEQAAKNYQ
ncbi:MAG: hypothetical protein HKN06_12880 [Gammaproteobacteria bacterium]|nr:hypothetical protein [Gammaproteobacteria bacterium]